MYKYLLSLALLAGNIQLRAQVPGSAVDVQHYNFNIILNDQNDEIKGQADIQLSLCRDIKSIAFDLDNKASKGKGMQVLAVTEGGKKLPYVHADGKLVIKTTAKSGTNHAYRITYSGVPADGLIISKNKYGDRTFFGDNWLRRARKWLPCVDDVADKAGVDFIVTAPAHYSVVANGLKVSEKQAGENKTTHWHEDVPVSTKVMVIGVADFAISTPEFVNQVPVNAYTFKQDKSNGFKAYACAPEILNFYNQQIGPYAYKKLANVQSKTIFGGMENASNIFYYENSVNDKAIEALVAHEVAHQWFGDAATESGVAHVWLSEGFATYFTHYYHEHKYGADSLRKRMITDRKGIFAFEKERMTPVVDTTNEKADINLLNTNSYQKASWVLYMLRRQLGDANFIKGIRTYYSTYKNGNAGTENFRAVMEKAGNQNLEQFFKQWLYTAGHPRLRISYETDKTNHGIHLHIEQLQPQVYQLKVDLKIGSTNFTAEMKDKALDLNIAAPTQAGELTVDPNVNLLAEYEIVNNDK
ncbi:M1 family metallopeptidase [Mucilaginibacter sp. UR6-1]|uniref:M1 family metallopeptidase n=1 Tax=Mucilaginibacter sp. UR6-1 TaxID=1435643 RepID=UPI001E473AE4|nr:M1 family metallopeptidase [Mucilaginibacter sp. UR6-1]MCC8411002.1 M1 family metallopeptidase [Mucilaginibacter sp. UR6-1]